MNAGQVTRCLTCGLRYSITDMYNATNFSVMPMCFYKVLSCTCSKCEHKVITVIDDNLNSLEG